MNNKIVKADHTSKFLFNTFIIVSIARISVGLYEWHRKRNNKKGCACKGKA